MKKIIFAMQVFVLVASFPVYLLTELDHGKANPVKNATLKPAPEKNYMGPVWNTGNEEIPFMAFRIKTY